MEIWPNFFIVGVPRAGTTTLHDMLNRTEGIFMPPHKEPHYFSTIDPSTIYPPPIRDKKKFLNLFKNVKDEKVIGEASTSYLWCKDSPRMIHDKVPNAKIIIILRDPIQRAFSHYLLRKSHGKKYSFSEAIKGSMESKDDYYTGEITNGGYYTDGVKRYMDMFGSKNVKVLIFEEFFKDPKNNLMDVLLFLKVESDPVEYKELVHNYLTEPRGKIATYILQNKILRKIGRDYIPERTSEFIVRKVLGKKIKKPKINQEDIIFLRNMYKNDVDDLKKILGRDFPWSLD